MELFITGRLICARLFSCHSFPANDMCPQHIDGEAIEKLKFGTLFESNNSTCPVSIPVSSIHTLSFIFELITAYDPHG